MQYPWFPPIEDMDDDSDDDVNVVIRDIAAPSAYSGFKIGKGAAPFGAPTGAEKAKVGGRGAQVCSHSWTVDDGYSA